MGYLGGQKLKLRCKQLKLTDLIRTRFLSGRTLRFYGLDSPVGPTLRSVWAGLYGPSKNFEVSGWCPVSVRCRTHDVHTLGLLQGAEHSGLHKYFCPCLDDLPSRLPPAPPSRILG